MSKTDSKGHSAEELLDALRLARGRARVQAHLFSLDAKQRWQALETTVLELEARVEQSGARLATGAKKSFRELNQAVKDLLHELDGSLELATPVRELMKQKPSTCAPDDSLNRAAQIMWEVDGGAVPVLAPDGRLVGMLTDRDICMAAYTRGQTLLDMSVESAMSKLVHSCSPSDSLGHAIRVMAERQIRRLPVVEKGKLVGILALADVAREVAKREGNRIPACVALAHALSAISEGRESGACAQAAAE